MSRWFVCYCLLSFFFKLLKLQDYYTLFSLKTKKGKSEDGTLIVRRKGEDKLIVWQKEERSDKRSE